MMTKNKSIAIMIYGQPGSARNALSEEKYRGLAEHFIENGFTVDSILYHDSLVTVTEKLLLKYDAILVWINPIEQGNNRKILDELLVRLADKGRFVSAHPDTILKIGTKEVLYKTKDCDFGGEVHLYHSYEDFTQRFLNKARANRILKQYRGNGGDGVFKIDTSGSKNNRISITHAIEGDVVQTTTPDQFFSSFQKYFENDGMLIDQPWNQNITNGMVRCYLSGPKVAGFGYQEINALYPGKKPGRRFYFSDDCRLFQDLKMIMENKWIGELQQVCDVRDELLPVIWDADFFINNVNTENTSEKYTLCEINTSSVSPFPESAIPYIVEALEKRI